MVIFDFLQQEQIFAMKLAADLKGSTQLATQQLEGSLMNVANESAALLAALNNGTAELGTEAGVNVTIGQVQLTAADDQTLSMLMTLASSSGSQSGSVRGSLTRKIGAQSGGGGCLAVEAAAALSDNSAGNAAAFSTDIANLFQDSETSPACKAPGAAAAAAGIVDGAGAAALSILSQASNPQVAPAVPAQALAFADLAPAGQLISIGVSLAQTSPQALQSVVNSVNGFNQAASSQLMTVITSTQGPTLAASYTSTQMTATSLAAAVPPLDGAYSGTFTGNENVTVANPCPTTVASPISGTLDLSASGATIATTAPAAGSGMLSNGSGNFNVAIPSLADPNATCTFNGTFLADTTGGASASGTWSCTPSATSASGFLSANGYWSASRQ